MKIVEVSKTTFRDTTLAGGWRARVPTPSFARDDLAFQDLVRTLMRMGAPPAKADELAREALTSLFEGSYVSKLKMYVGRLAREYESKHGTLEGFEPEKLARVFVPGSDHFWGRRRNFLVRREMRDET